MSSISNFTIQKRSKVLAVYNCRITMSQILALYCSTVSIFKLHFFEISDPYSKNISHIVKLWPLLLYLSMDCRLSAACMQPLVVQTTCRHMHVECSCRLHFRMHCTRTTCSHCNCIARNTYYSRPGSIAAHPW
jgi:hypothetical protein